MVLFKKIRPRRGSLAVSIICGSPIAANSRSAALAYRIGSPRHDSRYSAIDISVSFRASKDRAKALNRESLYMIPLLIWFAALLERAAKSDAAGAQRPEHVLALVEAVHGAHVDAVHDFAANTALVDDEGQLSVLSADRSGDLIHGVGLSSRCSFIGRTWTHTRPTPSP